jgi:hypothetical protein
MSAFFCLPVACVWFIARLQIQDECLYFKAYSKVLLKVTCLLSVYLGVLSQVNWKCTIKCNWVYTQEYTSKYCGGHVYYSIWKPLRERLKMILSRLFCGIMIDYFKVNSHYCGSLPFSPFDTLLFNILTSVPKSMECNRL